MLTKEQRKEYYKEWYQKNKKCLKERRKEYIRNYRQKNKEAIQEQRKEHWQKNKGHIKEYQKEYRNRNIQHIKEREKFYDKGHRKERNFRNRLRQYKLKLNGSHTLGEWETLKAQYNWVCPSCRRSEPEIILTEDHIIPVSKGGSNNIENIQPLCGPCNSKKYTNIIRYSPEEEINILPTEE